MCNITIHLYNLNIHVLNVIYKSLRSLKSMVPLEATYSTECNTTLTTPGSNALTFVSICSILGTDNTFLSFLLRDVIYKMTFS